MRLELRYLRPVLVLAIALAPGLPRIRRRGPAGIPADPRGAEHEQAFRSGIRTPLRWRASACPRRCSPSSVATRCWSTSVPKGSVRSVTSATTCPCPSRFSRPSSQAASQPHLIFYCSCPAEELALEAARVLIEAGDHKVAVLVGGFDAWRAAQGPVEMGRTWNEAFRVDDVPTGWGRPRSTPCAADTHVMPRWRPTARRAAASPAYRTAPQSDSAVFPSTSILGCVAAGSWCSTPWCAPSGWVAERSSSSPPKTPRARSSRCRSLRPIRWRARGNGMTSRSGGVPTEAQQVLIGLSLIGAGQVWLDDVKLVAPEGNGLPRVRLVVTNSGFEE